MNKNQLGKSDLYISELTLGCMSLGTNVDNASKIIESALDSGINHLDTADLYDFGINEEIVGSVIKNKRDNIILTSKVGNHFNAEKKAWYWDPSKEHIESGIKDSLRRLNTDYLDLYLLHGGTIEDPIDEVIHTMETLKKEGTIRAYGISSIRPNVIREYVKRSNIDAVMMQYNMFDRRPEEEVLDLLNENSISVLARGPLAKGMLSNKGLEVIHSKGKEGYLDYSSEDLIEGFQKLHSLSAERSMNGLALGYVLKHPAVASAVFGASSMHQLIENTASGINLETSVYRKVQEITKAITYTNHR
ncbi:aldo/keto reductase [Ornithinibacillus halophilus]|uniref:Predicted oxidoreductase n=1 Tax=Ornithinibacillus halophilus TaxID=930117 RepID=A0A1M5CW19_9BACI|nr:aldo/keto reductase [Ornithinibacillus halophilus]SHF58612.1 Predicted oxidoreductase [Ornithinibacillus halophilus]